MVADLEKASIGHGIGLQASISITRCTRAPHTEREREKREREKREEERSKAHGVFSAALGVRG